MSDRIACFIDGGYLDRVVRDQFPGIIIDYAKLLPWMANGTDLLRGYYYNCLPYRSKTPTPEENKRFAKAESFHTYLRTVNKMDIRQGRLAYRGNDQTGNPIFEQKGIDVHLALDLARLSFKQKITHAAICTADSDFIPVIEAAKDEGVSVRLYYGNGHRPNAALWNTCDEHYEISPETIDMVKK